MSTATSGTLNHVAWVLRGNPLTAVAAVGVAILLLAPQPQRRDVGGATNEPS